MFTRNVSLDEMSVLNSIKLNIMNQFQNVTHQPNICSQPTPFNDANRAQRLGGLKGSYISRFSLPLLCTLKKLSFLYQWNATILHLILA